MKRKNIQLEKIMKVRPLVRKTILMLLVAILIIGAIIFGFTFTLFLQPLNQWDWKPFVVIGAWILLSASVVVFTFVFSYYVVYKKYVEVKRLGKTLVYYYSDVVYIDESQYSKNKTIAFFTRQGHPRYLIGDKKDILYTTMIQNCKNRVTPEDFQRLYPKVKL